MKVREGGPDARLGAALLVHGWGGDGGSWSPLLAYLCADAVWAPDLLGHGSRVTDKHPPVTIEQVVDDVARQVQGCDLDIAVGHSMGAQVVLRLALGTLRIRALVMVDPAYCADAREISQAPARLRDLECRGALSAAEFAEGAFLDGRPAALQRAVVSQMLATPGPVLASLYASMYLEPDSLGPIPAARAALERLRMPVLSVHSTPEAAARAQEVRWPNGSEVVVWSGVGHYLHLERPAEFGALVRDWWQSL